MVSSAAPNALAASVISLGFTVAGKPVTGLTVNGSSIRTCRMLTVAVGAPSTIEGAAANQASHAPKSLRPRDHAARAPGDVLARPEHREVVGEEDPRRGGKEPQRQHELDPAGQRVGADGRQLDLAREARAGDDLERVAVDLAE